MPELPSPSGPWPPNSTEANQSEIRKAIDSIEAKGRKTKAEIVDLTELTQAQENYKQDILKAAAIVSGQVQSSPDGSITLDAGEKEKNQARVIHSLTLAATSVLNAAWLFYVGEDMPEGLKETVAIAIQGLPWAGVFLYLNRVKR